jgi:hypothetical protein
VFFFKKKAELKYIGLEDAVIKFQRSDSVWNQQFFLDYFSSPVTGTKPKKNAGIVFNLKRVEMKNVSFSEERRWLGETMYAHVGQLSMDADTLSLSGNQYEIKSLLLTDPTVAITTYARLKPRTAYVEPIDDIVKAVSWNSGQTMFKIGNVKIVNGTFRSERPSAPISPSPFDGQRILFTEIQW